MQGHTQFVSIVNNKFVVNGNASCPIYLNGANNPWESWDDFGGTYNAATWDQDMVNLKNKGINAARIWFSCDGNGQPKISTDGSTTSAPSAAFWQNCDSLFASAKKNGIYIMATMMSFDHTKNANTNSSNWQNMLNSSAGVTSYVNNYIVPFVNRYKTNPYLCSIDICNEIEWIYENGAGGGDGSNWKNSSYPILQRFVAMCAAGIHNNPRTDGTTVLATVGSASVKWNGSLLPPGVPGGGSANSTGNKWSDANLKAQYNQTNAVLDFYSPHYYGWMEQYYSSPFEHTPADFGMSEKPCVVGEMPAQSPVASDYSGYPTTTMTLTTAFNNLLSYGWQGHQPWTANITTNLTAEVGDLATFGSYAQAFYNSNTSLVKPSCPSCTTAAPTTTKAVNYCKGATASALTATAGTGGTLNWYTTATGGTASSTAPTPSTTTTGTTSYYVSQTISSCESPRDTIVVTINAVPAAPTVTSPVTYCQNATASALTATGTSLLWYTVATGGTSSTTAPTPSTTTTGTTSYYVSQTTTGCESPRATLAVTVNTTPAAPTVTSPVSYCQNATASALTATGTSLLWYTVATGGTGSATAPTPNTATTGTTSYYVSQTTTGCESPRATIAVTINTIPSAPIVTTPVTYCQNATASALTATGTSLKWYTVATGGTSSTTAPTPSTTTTGTTSYYVSQTTGSCESPRATIAITVNPTPTAPTVTSPVTYCQNATASVLTATGNSLLWYTVVTGGTSSTTAPTPSTTTTGTTSYYVSQTTTGCESPRATIAITVNPTPTAPTVTSPVTYCQNATASALTAAGTTLKWYTVATGGTGSTTAPTPSTTTTGTTSYYVSQTTGSCESPRATIAVTVNATPTAPIVTSPVTYCQNGTATALTATGTSLKWYTAATGGTGSTTAPTPTTTATGTTSYYVSQTTTGCESPRATIAVTVNTTPAAPTVTSPVTYCQNAAASALTATGTSLLWYTVATGGTSSTTAPTPSTLTTGTTSYYVSQTTGSCESPRADIAVTVNTTSAAPAVTSPVTYCQNATASSLSATGTSLLWYTVTTGGTGSATAPTPTTTATGTTSYYVSQTITGCESPRAVILVTVNSVPSAPAVNSPLSYCQSATASALTATGTSLLWYTVASGGSGNSAAPIPTTASVGTTSYYVSQTITGCESPRAAITVTVNAVPSAPIVTSPVSYCQNATASALTATGTSLLWYTSASGGTGSSTAPTPGTTSVGTINYYVSQTITGCESPRATIAVTVDTPPSASNAGITQNITVTTATLTANTPAVGTGSWSVVSGAGSFANSASASTSVSGLSSGTNVFEWTISNGVCPSTSSTATVDVGSAPVSQTILGPVNVTSNAAGITYSVPATTGVSKVWTVPAGATITSYNTDSSQITVNFGTTSGNVSVNESNLFGSITSSLFVAVGNSPAQQTISGPVDVSSNTSAAYSITTPSGVTNHWSLPAGATITSSNADSSQVTISFGTTGGTVNVTQTNSFGSTVDTETISVGGSPVTQTISGPAYIAIGSTGVTYSIPDNTSSTYHWSLPPGVTITSANTDSSMITVNFGTTVETGTVSVTETNPYGSATSTLPTSVGTAPSSQSITGETNVTANETGVTYSVPDNSGSTYHWSLPAGAIITSANTDSSQIIVSFGSTGGSVSVTETNPYGTAASNTIVSVSSTTGVITATSQNSYILYPNPFSETATLRVNSSEQESVSISITDVNGVAVYSSTGNTNENIVVGNTISASGIYFVQVSFGSEVKVLKLVKI